MATPIPATGSISQSAEAPTSANSGDLVEIPEELAMLDAMLEFAMLDSSRQVKQKIRNARRNVFKAWRWTLMGNVHFLHAVMRNGIFQLRDQQDLATALLQEQSSVDEHHADDVAGAVESVPNRHSPR